MKKYVNWTGSTYPECNRAVMNTGADCITIAQINNVSYVFSDTLIAAHRRFRAQQSTVILWLYSTDAQSNEDTAGLPQTSAVKSSGWLMEMTERFIVLCFTYYTNRHIGLRSRERRLGNDKSSIRWQRFSGRALVSGHPLCRRRQRSATYDLRTGWSGKEWDGIWALGIWRVSTAGFYCADGHLFPGFDIRRNAARSIWRLASFICTRLHCLRDIEFWLICCASSRRCWPVFSANSLNYLTRHISMKQYDNTALSLLPCAPAKHWKQGIGSGLSVSVRICVTAYSTLRSDYIWWHVTLGFDCQRRIAYKLKSTDVLQKCYVIMCLSWSYRHNRRIWPLTFDLWPWELLY